MKPIAAPEWHSTPHVSAPATALQATIIYREITAGQRAAEMIPRLIGSTKPCPSELALRVQFWRFDLIALPEFRIPAAADLRASDIIIVADATDTPLEPELKGWLAGGLADCSSNGCAVVALFGLADEPDSPDSARLQFVQEAARDAGLSFFAPLPQAKNSTRIRREEIHRRAEAMTPTLEHLMARPVRALFHGYN